MDTDTFLEEVLGKFVDNLDVNDIYGDIERTASIVGVEITDPGEGYTDEPLVSFSDSCDKGYGAYGQAVVDKNVNSPTYGQITNIVILSEGVNYPVDLPAETKPVYIKEIIVENPGKGYEDAEIEDECLTLNVVDGRIKSIDVTCQKEYDSIPTIKIKNAGFGYGLGGIGIFLLTAIPETCDFFPKIRISGIILHS